MEWFALNDAVVVYDMVKMENYTIINISYLSAAPQYSFKWQLIFSWATVWLEQKRDIEDDEARMRRRKCLAIHSVPIRIQTFNCICVFSPILDLLLSILPVTSAIS